MALWLHDILDQAQAAARLVGRGREAFDRDEMLRFAAESLLIKMGECVDRIHKADPLFVETHPELELRPLKDTRNVLAHRYDIVDYALVWSIIEVNIPAVALKIRQFLNSEGLALQ